jgi:protease PrsW
MSTDAPSAKVQGTRRALRVQALLLGGLLGFVALVWGIDRARGGAPIEIGVAGALILALVPALLWLGYFYLRDVHEPEPTHYVVGVFLLGALVAAPLASLVTDSLFKVPTWGTLPRWGMAETVGAFLVIAPAQEASKYLVVRYTAYLSDEFDEPVDGIVYMTAAGLGFAVAWNVQQLSRAPQIELGTAGINVLTTTLAHAGLSGLVGYAMGRAKFLAGALARARVLAAGLAVAIGLSGAFSMLENMVTRRGLEYRPATGLAAATLFAAAIFVLLSVLVDRHLARSPHAAAPEGTP